MRREIKLLFLGAGESGKSTIMKQFQLAYGQPFTPEERDEYRDVIFDNAVRSMQVRSTFTRSSNWPSVRRGPEC
jgi:guanine nucleotide-binding protein subunit alpha